MNVSKSQAKRLAIQTEPIDVDLLQNELAMANGHIEWHRVELAKQIEMTNTLGAEVERLQAKVQRLKDFISDLQTGDSNETKN